MLVKYIGGAIQSGGAGADVYMGCARDIKVSISELGDGGVRKTLLDFTSA
jgi:hypothetical protein